MKMTFFAFIRERNIQINFTFQNLLDENFANRNLIRSWLAAGNIPDVLIIDTNEEKKP